MPECATCRNCGPQQFSSIHRASDAFDRRSYISVSRFAALSFTKDLNCTPRIFINLPLKDQTHTYHENGCAKEDDSIDDKSCGSQKKNAGSEVRISDWTSWSHGQRRIHGSNRRLVRGSEQEGDIAFSGDGDSSQSAYPRPHRLAECKCQNETRSKTASFHS